MDNLEILATLGTQDTGRRKAKHWVHKTQDEERQNTKTQHNSETGTIRVNQYFTVFLYFMN